MYPYSCLTDTLSVTVDSNGANGSEIFTMQANSIEQHDSWHRSIRYDPKTVARPA